MEVEKNKIYMRKITFVEVHGLRDPRPFSTTRLLVPMDPMSPILRTLGKECPATLPSPFSNRSPASWPGRMLSANWGGFKELERRVFWRTSATQASPSGLMDSYRARGLGPAKPSGVERESLAIEAVAVLPGEWVSPIE